MDDELKDIVLGTVNKKMFEVRWFCPECKSLNMLITDSKINSERDFCEECCENKTINWKL
jgi:hypothetical protein